MEAILSVIGLFVLLKFFARNRRLFMDKEAFYKSVKDLRQGIVKGWSNEYQHQRLDEIVHNVLGEPEMGIDNLEEDLAAHIIGHIKAVKQAQENDKLKLQAEKIIELINSELTNNKGETK